MSIVLFGVASGTVNSTLYTINTATGVATTVGTIGYPEVRGIAYNPSNGILYAVTRDTTLRLLLTINSTTGLGTISGTITPSGFVPSDACFSGAGILFAWNETNLPSDRLATVDLGTAVFTNKGPSGLSSANDGLAYKGSTLYVKGGNIFFSVDPISGAVDVAHPISCTGNASLKESLIFSGTIGYSIGTPSSGGANGLYSISDALTLATLVGTNNVATTIDSLTFGTAGTTPVSNTFSGVYTLTPGKLHDTLYATISSTTTPPTVTTIDNEIPEPSATLYGVTGE